MAITLGAFELISPLGRGGLAEVWRGVHRAGGVPVAVKVVGDHGSERAAAALRDEVRAVAELDHPNIIWVYGQGRVDSETEEASGGRLAAGSPWFAMELADDGALRDPRGWTELRDVLIPLLQALAYAHAHGVIHRDVKPANVLFGGARPGLKLSDFGLMVALGSPIAEQGASGTPAFMAPEQCLGNVRAQGPWTDLYAVGCVAYRLACGRNPYLGSGWASVFSGHVHEPVPELNPRFDVPDGFDAWVERLMQKAPRDRYRWAADAIRDLEQLQADPSTEPPIPTTWRRPAAPRFDADLAGAGLGLFGLRQVPIQGMEAPRDALWSALTEVAQTQRPRAVVLRGAPGTGKSRLAEWLTRRAHEVGAASAFRTLHTPDEGPDQGLPGLVLRALRCEHLDREGVLERLEFALRERGMHEAMEVERLGQYLRPTDADVGRQPLGPAERHSLVRRVIQRELDGRPGVVWLDDVQWGVDALRFVRRVLTSGDLPVLFALTWRDEQPARDLEVAELDAILELASAIELEPLAYDDHKALVRSLLQLDPELEARVCETTGGNPGFAVQLLTHWVQGDRLEPSPAGYRLRSSRTFVPASETELHRRRLATVLEGRGDAWRYPLELAATLGLIVDGEEWDGVCRIRRVRPDPELVAALRDAGLARPVAGSVGSWVFRQPALRQVLLDEATADGRMESHHRACARMLSTSAGPGVAARLGVHSLAGGDLERATGPLHDGAQEHFLAGEYGLAERLLTQRDQALQLLSPPSSDPRWGQSWLLWTHLRRSQGRFEEARNWLVKVLGTARLHGWTELEIRARIQASKVGEDHETSARDAQRAVDLATELGDPFLIAEARYQQLIEASNYGEIRAAVDGLPGIIETLEAQGRWIRSQNAWISLSHTAMQADRTELVQTALERAEALDAATGSRYNLAQIAMVRGEVARLAGRLAEAEIEYLEAWRLHDAMGNVAALMARIHVALTRAELGRFEEATHELETCLRLSERPLYRLVAHLGLVLCCSAGPDDGAWRRHCSAVEAWSDLGRADTDVARVLELAGNSALDAGHGDRADQAFALAATQLDQLGRIEEAEALRASRAEHGRRA